MSIWHCALYIISVCRNRKVTDLRLLIMFSVLTKLRFTYIRIASQCIQCINNVNKSATAPRSVAAVHHVNASTLHKYMCVLP